MQQVKQGARLVLTVGHSKRSIAEFIELLRAHGALAGAGIGYVHMPKLGGLRRARPDSPNTGWRNASFRGYADHMQTPQFAEALEEVIALTGKERIALMCAEALPWRCHRSLIADALLARGIAAEDIASPTRRTPHKLTPFARVRGTEITYPPESDASGDLFGKGV